MLRMSSGTFSYGGVMMTTAEERKQVLKMVQEGKISVEEGERLLEALAAGDGSGSGEGQTPGSRLPRKMTQGRWLRVRVSDMKSGRSKATINIPLALMEWGLKIGAQFAPEVADIDLTLLREMLEKGSVGKIVDAVDEEDGEHVEIFIE